MIKFNDDERMITFTGKDAEDLLKICEETGKTPHDAVMMLLKTYSDFIMNKKNYREHSKRDTE